MNSELAKSQEHARRFQELLAVERRKQKGLRVRQLNVPDVFLYLIEEIHNLR